MQLYSGVDIIGLGTRFSDFTTGSKSLFQNGDLRFLTLNVNGFDAFKMDAVPLLCDARVGLEQPTEALGAAEYRSGYSGEIEAVRKEWAEEVQNQYFGAEGASGGYNQMRVLGIMNEEIFEPDAIAVAASGSLPGDM